MFYALSNPFCATKIYVRPRNILSKEWYLLVLDWISILLCGYSGRFLVLTDKTEHLGYLPVASYFLLPFNFMNFYTSMTCKSEKVTLDVLLHTFYFQ